MSVSQLRIENIRCIHLAELQPHSKFTLLSGPNGSGKSSILEAIHLLGLARSFRSNNIRKIISDHQNECRVIAQYIDGSGVDNRIGISKNRDSETLIRLNQQKLKTASELARILPIRVISQDNFSLIDGPAKGRRQFFDWLAFHVEHQFSGTWSSVQRLIKQRNSLLKHGQKLSVNELAAWDDELIFHGEKLNEGRKKVFQKYLENFIPLVESLLPGIPLQLSFYQGWPERLDLAHALRANIERDRNLGYTHSSPNRADLRIKVRDSLASEYLSRGQKKLLVCALTLAQTKSFFELIDDKKVPSIVLLDDIGAELDEANRQLLIETLDICNNQVFITGTEFETLETFLKKDSYKMFHVEQGSVTPA